MDSKNSEHEKSTSDDPNRRGPPNQKGEDVSQHHKMAQGDNPPVTGKKTSP